MALRAPLFSDRLSGIRMDCVAKRIGPVSVRDWLAASVYGLPHDLAGRGAAVHSNGGIWQQHEPYLTNASRFDFCVASSLYPNRFSDAIAMALRCSAALLMAAHAQSRSHHARRRFHVVRRSQGLPRSHDLLSVRATQRAAAAVDGPWAIPGTDCLGRSVEQVFTYPGVGVNLP